MSGKRSSVDVVILSYCKSERQYQMTVNCVNSLVQSESSIDFHVVLVETASAAALEEVSHGRMFGSRCRVVHPEKPFNYNEFLQIGFQTLGKTGADHLLISNNDVLFQYIFAHRRFVCGDENMLHLSRPSLHGKRALITGITGQDGSYLAELLLTKRYQVWGMIRRSSSFNTARIDHMYQDPHDGDLRLCLRYGDLQDGSSVNSLLKEAQPDEVYNLGAQSHVKVSFEVPEYTGEIAGLGTLRLLEGIRSLGLRARFYQASSSELFGLATVIPQSETTPFYPRSPYAAAKAYAFYITRLYREAYGMFAVNGMLFNHESPRRGETFVTRKITRAVARISTGRQQRLYLGNLDARRDWGFAGDYVQAMWQMLQVDRPDDYVVATGEGHSVREFCEVAFACVGLPLTWTGSGVHEKGIGPDGEVLVEVDPRYFRPAEVDILMGDASKAKAELGWEPRVKFAELVRMMVDADLKAESEGPSDRARCGSGEPAVAMEAL